MRAPLALRLSATEYAALCEANPEVRAEREPDGHVVMRPWSGFANGRRGALIMAHLGGWAEANGTGDVTQASTGFDLPDGSNRSPTAAWTLKSRLAVFASEPFRDGFAPLCPNFVVELDVTEARMLMYVANGARLC